MSNNTSNSSGSKSGNPRYPGIRVTCNGNYLVTQHVETRITEGGVFYPITPSTEGGEIYQQSFAFGELNVWGQQKVAIETEGEHAAQGGATAYAVQGRRDLIKRLEKGQIKETRFEPTISLDEDYKAPLTKMPHEFQSEETPKLSEEQPEQPEDDQTNPW